MKKITLYSGILLLPVMAGFLLSSCGKTFLDAKPSTSLVQPHTIADFQQLLNNTDVFNTCGGLSLASSDEYQLTDYPTYQSVTQILQNCYTWQKDIYAGQGNIPDWNVPYQAVFYANNVLDGLPNSDGVGTSEWNRTKGWALFNRAYAFYSLAQDFCQGYDSGTAPANLGISLRLSAGIDVLVQRSTLQQTYDQILTDLHQSRVLLTNAQSLDFRNQPSQEAVCALLARIYLSMRQYTKAEAYADSCMAISNKLIDYNTVSLTSTSPFTFSNDESIYFSAQVTGYGDVTYGTNGKYAIVNSLLSSYAANDLRRTIFYRTYTNGNVIMKRGYSGKITLYTGLAMDEVYLIKAECAARRSDIPTAVSFLNALLVKRFKTGSFVPLTAISATDALNQVLTERGKELVRRGLRWSDIKRLNLENANITLTRTVNGQVYSLPPNDPRYVFPIPGDEISFSGITQNPR